MADKNKTEYVKIRGKVSWAKVYEPDDSFGAEKWKINVYPENDEELEKFKKSGIQKAIKEDSGEKSNVEGKFFELTRDTYKLIKGAMVNFTGPVILDTDGKVITDYVDKVTGNRVYSYDAKNKENIVQRGRRILIGNGSLCEVTVAVYDTFKGKGQRLESIRVLDLIEYEGGSTPPELSPLVTTTERKESEQTLKKETETSKLLDDEIPFEVSKEDPPW